MSDDDKENRLKPQGQAAESNTVNGDLIQVNLNLPNANLDSQVLKQLGVGRTQPVPAEASYPKVVFKGLRSFDENDAGFFLRLLPGPFDADGLPENIRFWKYQIEETDPDKTFRVGLLHGPSGCGKSSLVKAGLLPHLSKDVIAVYVEATAEETETRLLNGLRRYCQTLPPKSNLLSTLQKIDRIPKGKKVLIVIDQFEQWLHANFDVENSEFLKALKECDGERVQCVLMVRDDFWTSVGRFLKKLGILQLEGKNTQMVDLFDHSHAKNVLTAFGQSIGKLDTSGITTNEQSAFLDYGLSLLANERRVNSIALVLFTELTRDEKWEKATLQGIDNLQEIGLTFLKAKFVSDNAPKRYKKHKDAAQSVLAALLPEHGTTELKGAMKSEQHLKEILGIVGRKTDWDDLRNILDSDLRIITETAQETQAPDDERDRSDELGKSVPVELGRSVRSAKHEASQTKPRFYQLTHDLLVPAVREWVIEEQKKTRRGRAELLLVDRASVWSARPENRHLPSLLEWLTIGCLTQKKQWTKPQREMIQKASWYHAKRGLALALFLTVMVAAALVIGDRIVENQKKVHAETLVRSLFNAEIDKVPGIIVEMKDYRSYTTPKLQKVIADRHEEAHGRKMLYANLALLPEDSGKKEFLVTHLLYEAGPPEISLIRNALDPFRDDLKERLWPIVITKPKDRRFLCAAACLAKYDPDNNRWEQISSEVARQLAIANQFYAKDWLDNFQPVKNWLKIPLADLFRARDLRGIERVSVANIIAEYASDDVDLLTELLLDADEKSFSVLYNQIITGPNRQKVQFLSDPKVQQHGMALQHWRETLEGELSKAVKKEVVPILNTKGEMDKDSSLVKIAIGKSSWSLPSKFFPVKMKSGKTYTMTMDSTDLDSFLLLQDSDGNQLDYDDNSGGNKNARLDYAPSKDGLYKVYAISLDRPTGMFSLSITEIDDKQLAKEKLAKRQANAGVALLKQERPAKVWEFLRHSGDPRGRSYLIHFLRPLGSHATGFDIPDNDKMDVSVRRALVLRLGGFELLPSQTNWLKTYLLKIFQSNPDPGLHGAAEWLLRRWECNDEIAGIEEQLKKEKNQRLEEIRGAIAKEAAKPHWYVNSAGQTMVVIPRPGEVEMGSPRSEVGREDGNEGENPEMRHKKTIDRSYVIGAKEVTVEQFIRLKDHYYKKQYSLTANHPMTVVSWYEAVEYCNLLSEKDGILKDDWCYEPNKEGKYADGMKVKPNYLQLAGYRLPTEAEWEYACRAGAVTGRFYGETEDLLEEYAWFRNRSMDRKTLPVGSLKPNDLGLFDMLGNAAEWCHDGVVVRYSSGLDQGHTGEITNKKMRVIRGGSFLSQPGDVRCAARSWEYPNVRNFSHGFRPARTFSP